MVIGEGVPCSFIPKFSIYFGWFLTVFNTAEAFLQNIRDSFNGCDNVVIALRH